MQQHLLWQAEANEFIQHYPPQRRRRCPPTTMLMQQRRSTGLMYTHPPTTALMTLNKRASTGGGIVHGNSNSNNRNGNGNGNGGNGDNVVGMGMSMNVGMSVGVSGGKLLSAQQRHQRDLFTGELGTHVGNVVHTFETLALQRRLAEHSQHKKQQQSKQQTYGKYLVGGLKFNKQQLKQRQQAQKHQYNNKNNNNNNKNQYTNYNSATYINRNTLNERNKEISAQYLAMEADYRKNFMKDENDCTKIVNAAFDDMLASYSDDIDDNITTTELNKQQQPITSTYIEINKNSIDNDFIRGSTISQSFVRPTTTKIKKQAPLPPPPPPPLPPPPIPSIPTPTPSPTPTTTTTTFQNSKVYNNKAQCRLTLANPFRHVFFLPSKRSKSFNLI